MCEFMCAISVTGYARVLSMYTCGCVYHIRICVFVLVYHLQCGSACDRRGCVYACVIYEVVCVRVLSPYVCVCVISVVVCVRV